MGKTIVLYQSKYGATKKYADWLSQDLSCDLLQTKETSIEQVKKYDTIILGGGLYATGIAGFSFIKKHYQDLKDKKVVVFAVGASPYHEKSMQEIRERNFKGDLEDLPCFYFRGAWNEDKMSFKDKTLCRMLKKVVSKKDPADYEPWEEALMDAIGSQFDWTNKESLKPLIEYVHTT